MKKKFLAVLLTLTIAISLLPTAAMAIEDEFAEMTIDDVTTAYSDQAAFLTALTSATGKTISIKLLADITVGGYVPVAEGQTVTLDLNGCHLSTTEEEPRRHYYAIHNYGQLTIEDSVGTGKITARGIQNLGNGVMVFNSGTIVACDSNGGACIWNEADLTINGGNFETVYEGSASDQYGVGCINNSGSALITGGKFNDVNKRTYAIISTGEMVITPASEDSVTVFGAHGALSSDGGTLVVNGGMYTSSDYYGLYVSNDGKGGNPMVAAVTVNGGTFTGPSYSVLIGSDINDPVNSTIEITGGTFKKPLNAQECTRPGAIQVSGGKFSTDVSQYVKTGYICKLSADDKNIFVVEPLGEGNAVASVTTSTGNSTYHDTLSAAIAAAEAGDTVKLLKDIEETSTVSIDKSITLDLNGKLIKNTGGVSTITISAGTVAVKDSQTGGVIESSVRAVRVNSGTLNLQSGTLKGTYGIFATGSASKVNITGGRCDGVYGLGTGVYVEKAAELNMSAGEVYGRYYGISGNGSNGDGNTKIEITGGTVSASETKDDQGCAIFHPQEGTLNLSGNAVLTGGVGVQMCSGVLNVSGNASITTNGISYTGSYEQGRIPDAAAISIVNRTGYASAPQVNIQGGLFAARNEGLAIHVYTWNGTGDTASAPAWEGAKEHVFISGGYYTSDPSEYVVAEKAAVSGSYSVDGKTYQYWVTDSVIDDVDVAVTAGETKAEVSENLVPGGSSVTVEDIKTAAEGIQATEGLTEQATKDLATLTDGITKEQAVDKLKQDNKYTEGADITIVAEPYLNIQVKAYAEDGVDTEITKTLTLEITPMCTIKATTGDPAKAEGETGAMREANTVVLGTKPMTVTETVILSIPVPKNFVADGNTVYVQHKSYEYEITVTDGKAVFENPYGFSVFKLSTKSTAAAEVDGTKYLTLQAAIDAVKNGKTVKVLKDGSAKVSGNKTFTVQVVDGVKADLKAASGYVLTDDGKGKYTVTKEATKPSTTDDDDDDDDDDSYSVSVDAGKHGKITVSPRTAEKGETVTITVKPDKGYELDELTVTTKSGKTVKLTEGKNGKFTFKMPDSRVTVEAAFTRIVETPRFIDVPDGYWAENAIEWAAENGYMKGNTADTFNPGGKVTRQQLWMILARLSGQRPDDFVEARAWAVGNGVSDGTNPGSAVSRQQLVTILYRYAVMMGYDVSVGEDTNILSFNDFRQVSEYAVPAMQWAAGAGIITGTTEGNIMPLASTTRAQFATILMRFCENVIG